MNPWWLLLVVPVSAFVGFVISCLLGMAACTDCKEAIRYRESTIQDISFKAGFKEGLLKVTEVG